MKYFILLILTMSLFAETKEYKLPPEPDPKINNSTLLGIDSNNNGVRDDVERWIYKTYTHPIERGIFMQSARAYNMVIIDPSKALKTMRYNRNAFSCEAYWKFEATANNERFSIDIYRDLDKEIEKVQFNTLERHKAYDRYNKSLSGGIYSTPKADKGKCEFDEKGVLGNLK